eukprot:scaffold292467_cov52-Prasinocladus_malaysianus.AAC.1
MAVDGLTLPPPNSSEYWLLLRAACQPPTFIIICFLTVLTVQRIISGRASLLHDTADGQLVDSTRMACRLLTLWTQASITAACEGGLVHKLAEEFRLREENHVE